MMQCGVYELQVNCRLRVGETRGGRKGERERDGETESARTHNVEIELCGVGSEETTGSRITVGNGLPWS